MAKRIPPPIDIEPNKFLTAKRRRDELHEKSNRTGLSDDEATEQKRLNEDLAQLTRDAIKQKQQ